MAIANNSRTGESSLNQDDTEWMGDVLIRCRGAGGEGMEGGRTIPKFLAWIIILYTEERNCNGEKEFVVGHNEVE